MTAEEIQTVDIDRTIRDKNPGLFKLLPRFVLNYIKRIARQDDLNEILVKYGEYAGLDFIAKTLEHLNITYSVIGVENFPAEDGRYIFASNHPLGGLDGLILLDLTGKHYGDVKFVVNDLLMYLKPLESVFVPVNKHGRQSNDYVGRIDNLYASDSQVLYFPAGICSRKIDGKIIDLEWKKNFITKAVKYKRDVVPVYFDARNSAFFYNLSRIRTALRIKANLEMFYLSDEFFKKRNSRFTVRIGKPISYSEFDIKNAAANAAFVRNAVYDLATTEFLQ